MSLSPPQLLTKSSEIPDARRVVLPEGIVTTGFPATENTCAEIGIRFDGWQRDLNRCLLAKDEYGDYAADTAVLSIARQVGKTFDVGAVVFADSIIVPGTTTIWTAHRFKVSRESFNELRALARSPLLTPHIEYDDITTAAGNECIPFRNGSRIVFAARERGAIRGFTKVRRLVLDEAQILTAASLADLAPTMNQADNPQIILMGTPPKPTDPSEVFSGIRAEALEGNSSGVLYVELSAESDCDSDDRVAWRQANPSYPRRTSDKAISRLRKLLGAADFRREALGIWDDDAQKSDIDLLVWAELEHMETDRPSPVRLAVQVSDDRQWTHIGLAGQRSDGHAHLQVVESFRGTGEVAKRLRELQQQWSSGDVALAPGGPSGSLIPALEAEGVKVASLWAREVAAADAGYLDRVVEKTVRHSSQPVLNIAVRAARKQPTRNAWVWRSNEPGTDIAPLKAVTLALYELARAKTETYVPKRLR